MIKKIGILTFHAAHNYGSMLQAYALQRTVMEMGYECEIINFRTDRQKNFYKPFYKKNGFRSILKAILFPRLAINDSIKHRLFEEFINKYMLLTKEEYSSTDDLNICNLDFDVYISGSDQIWNTSCFDFDTVFFLDFVKKGKLVAYAPSMGPDCLHQITQEKYKHIKKYLSSYDFVSVRDLPAAKLIDRICGYLPPITLDPTLLVRKEVWSAFAGTDRLVAEDYILLYTPWYDEKLYFRALELSKQYNMKIVITIHDYYHRWQKYNNIKFLTAVGPLEFLNLVKYARMVISGSFHAVVFSIIFSKHFYAYRGKQDDRIVSLMNILNINQQGNTIDNDIEIREGILIEKNETIQKVISDSLIILKESLT